MPSKMKMETDRLDNVGRISVFRLVYQIVQGEPSFFYYLEFDFKTIFITFYVDISATSVID